MRFLFGTFKNAGARLYLSTYFLVIPCLVCVVVSLRKRKLKNHSCKNNRNIHAAQTTAFYSLRNRQTLDFYLWVLMNLSLAYYCIVESRVEQYTVSSVLEAAASNYFDVILDQILLSKKCVLLRLLFEGGFYLRAASYTEFTVFS